MALTTCQKPLHIKPSRCQPPTSLIRSYRLQRLQVPACRFLNWETGYAWFTFLLKTKVSCILTDAEEDLPHSSLITLSFPWLGERDCRFSCHSQSLSKQKVLIPLWNLFSTWHLSSQHHKELLTHTMCTTTPCYNIFFLFLGKLWGFVCLKKKKKSLRTCKPSNLRNPGA